ncbi:MAG TPA: ABC transporter ATP-binding protein [Terriglobales bacterium]|nr:ABC transporter ATP-binding protein [Terriglobales bacterium]
MLRADGLWKSYGPVRALRGVGFSLERGRVTALLGENGAGKTTTLRVVLGILAPDAGAVEREAGRVGYVPDQPAFFPWLRGRDVLDLTRRSAGAGREEWGARVRDLAAALRFDAALLDRPPRTYSAGNAKKLAFLQSLALEPDLLVADEPFAALDPPSVKRARDLLIGARDRGAAVLLSSHMLAEMTRVSDDFIVLRHGKVAARSGLAEFLERARPASAGEVEAAFLGLIQG